MTSAASRFHLKSSVVEEWCEPSHLRRTPIEGSERSRRSTTSADTSGSFLSNADVSTRNRERLAPADVDEPFTGLDLVGRRAPQAGRIGPLAVPALLGERVELVLDQLRHVSCDMCPSLRSGMRCVGATNACSHARRTQPRLLGPKGPKRPRQRSTVILTVRRVGLEVVL